MIAKHKIFISLLIFYLLLFLPFLGGVHLFDWDEINFAEAAREMLVTGDWLNVKINYEPFWEKPPLFIWLQAISMQTFGVNEFAARLPNVLVGLVTLIVLYKAVLQNINMNTAIWSVLVYIGSITPHFYFRTGIIDPLFNLFMFASVLSMVAAIRHERSLPFLWAGLWLGFAVLTKGPVALLIVGLTGLVYQLVHRHNFYDMKSLLLLVMGVLIVPGLYFGVHVVHNGWWFLQEFLIYQVDLFRYPIASHGQPFYYHFVVLLIGCFPLAILGLRGLGRYQPNEGRVFFQWSKVLFWVVLILFSLVTTKIVHYSSMTYLPLSVIAAVWITQHHQLTRLQNILIGVLGLFWGVLFMSIGMLGIIPRLRFQLMTEIQDAFAVEQIAGAHEGPIAGLVLGAMLLGLVVYYLLRRNTVALSSFLVFNALILSMFLNRQVPWVEETIQGQWVDQLSRYQGRRMVHFTDGFKSYAHYFYTRAEPIPGLEEVRQKVLRDMGHESYYDLDQFSKQEYDARVRYEVIENTDIPITVSAKTGKFDELNSNPKLRQVFGRSGYGVWERNIIAQESH